MKALWLKIGGATTILATIIGLIANYGSATLSAGHKISFFFDNFEHFEHLIDDGHQILSMTTELEKVKDELDSACLVIQQMASEDSTIHAMELLNRGKYPYDSIWIKSESGHSFLTTVEEHFITRHND